MVPAILLSVVGVVMLCQGLIRWNAGGKRFVLVGTAMILAAGSVYFIAQGSTALAYVCGGLLTACVVAALATGRHGWRKPEVILGLAAAATLAASSTVAEASAQWPLALAAGILGFASIGFTLRALLTDTPVRQRD